MYTHLAQQNGFGPTFLHSLLRLVEATEECNKYDLTTTLCYDSVVTGDSL
jgi:hypothetical protein